MIHRRARGAAVLDEIRAAFAAAAVAAFAESGCDAAPARGERQEALAEGLRCAIALDGDPGECPDVAGSQASFPLTLSPVRDLAVESARARWAGDDLVVDVRLAGGFTNAADQNLYFFVGGAAAADAGYTLSDDAGVFEGLGYPVRSGLALPHGRDLRIGVMAPAVQGYTPQIYGADRGPALLTGPEAGASLRSASPDFSAGLPLRAYYARLGKPLPDPLHLTVATARDYVGFVDACSLVVGAPDAACERREPPAAYPDFDPRSHALRRVAARPDGEGLEVIVETEAPVRDWAQTNVHLFFVPLPATPPLSPSFDPSRRVRLPYAWGFYCGIYSPLRVYCKAGSPADQGYDGAYAERRHLAMPEGVRASFEGRETRLRVDGARLREALGTARRAGLVVMVGRDGFGPTSVYGLHARRP
ncbi:MAG TPA: hypothetical protein VFS43_45105 [Polyangiaceae bacterium]|nr:hypothetical protein [Polyangiaceae bacterium]